MRTLLQRAEAGDVLQKVKSGKLTALDLARHGVTTGVATRFAGFLRIPTMVTLTKEECLQALLACSKGVCVCVCPSRFEPPAPLDFPIFFGVSVFLSFHFLLLLCSSIGWVSASPSASASACAGVPPETCGRCGLQKHRQNRD